MAIVNQVDKKVTLTLPEIVKFQLLTYCYLYRITVSEADLDCLTQLAIEGEQELTGFCEKMHLKNIFSSAQSVRNCLTKATKKNLIVKQGKNKKKINVNPSINVQCQGNILLDYKFLCIAS